MDHGKYGKYKVTTNYSYCGTVCTCVHKSYAIEDESKLGHLLLRCGIQINQRYVSVSSVCVFVVCYYLYDDVTYEDFKQNKICVLSVERCLEVPAECECISFSRRSCGVVGQFRRIETCRHYLVSKLMTDWDLIRAGLMVCNLFALIAATYTY